MTLTHDRRAELLANCPLFRGIDAEGVAHLAAVATPVDFPPGHVIAREGEIDHNGHSSKGSSFSDRIVQTSFGSGAFGRPGVPVR